MKKGIQDIQLIKLFNSLFQDITYYDYKNKFKTLKFILDNNFISKSDKLKLTYMFYRNQFINSNINKIIKIYKFKRKTI